MDTFIDIHDLSYSYGDRLALDAVMLQAPAGSFVALLGPNGSGKTTLFRILSGLQRPASGSARILELDSASRQQVLRDKLGVVFQSPSLDEKLTVLENLRHHGRLHGLWGAALRQRTTANLERFSLTARSHDRVSTLSGGLKRRVELARALLHQPSALFLDEPTTGLDPSARLDFWSLLQEIRREQKLSVLFTTHWFEEAVRADLVGIMDRGALVTFGKPGELTEALGHEIITITTPRTEQLAAELRARFKVAVTIQQDHLRFAVASGGAELLSEILQTYGEQISSITAGKPTLEDVYIAHTGHSFEEEAAS